MINLYNVLGNNFGDHSCPLEVLEVLEVLNNTTPNTLLKNKL